MGLDIQKEIKKSLQKVVGKKVEIILTEPPKSDMGDYSWAVFDLAKIEKKNPVELAKDLVDKIKTGGVIKKVGLAGPYLNFFVDRGELAKDILTNRGKRKKNKGKIVLDVFQANPLKVFHIGHFFNAVLGESIRRLLEFSGYKTVTYSYSGDVGVHVARWLWYFKNFYHGKIPAKGFTDWAGDIYAKACAKMKEDEKYAKQVDEMNQLIDKRDKSITPLWRKMTKRSYAASWKIAKELNCQVNHSFPESICEEPGKKFVQKKIKSGELVKDEGAYILNLKKEKLGVFILLKSDGTALYQTKDFGLAINRSRKIVNYKKCLFVVGSEQEYYFRQLFGAMKILKFPGWKKNEHVPHGLVSLQDSKISSREGNIISYDDLRDKAIAKILTEINKKNNKLRNKKKVAKIVALGGLKFSMLHTDRVRNTVFDWDKALSFEGSSGPYLQYTYARIKSIIRKARSIKHGAQNIKNINYSLLTSDVEMALIKTMDKFANVASKAADEYQPSIIANYLLDLASDFNHFYHECKVIDADNKELTKARLFLINEVAGILKQGLWLLGIDTVEEM